MYRYGTVQTRLINITTSEAHIVADNQIAVGTSPDAVRAILAAAAATLEVHKRPVEPVPSCREAFAIRK